MPSTAAYLRGNLSEQGLKRVLTKHNVNTAILQYNTPEEAARRLQRRFMDGPVRAKAKKSSRATIGSQVDRYKGKTGKKASKKPGAVGKARSVPNYKTRVWHELHVLICTNDKRYANVRKLFGKESRMTQTAMVTAIGAAIGSYIGAAATVVAPFVTLGLLAFLQVSKNAWCDGYMA